MLSTKDIKHLAELARIEVKKEETAALAKDVEAILVYVALVQKVAGGGDGGLEKNVPINVFREDAHPHESGIFTDALLSAVPKMEDGYVKVKKIL